MFRFLNEMFDNNKRDVQRLMKSVVQPVGALEDEMKATDDLAAAMDAFFALDLETKKTWRTPPQINRGYSPPKSESLSLSLGVESANRMNDFFEAFNVGARRARPRFRQPRRE